jgi:hypothetical protein
MSLLCGVQYASTKRVVVLGDTEWIYLTDLDSFASSELSGLSLGF